MGSSYMHFIVWVDLYGSCTCKEILCSSVNKGFGWSLIATSMHEVSISLCNSKIEISITISILTYKWKIGSLFKNIVVVT